MSKTNQIFLHNHPLRTWYVGTYVAFTDPTNKICSFLANTFYFLLQYILLLYYQKHVFKEVTRVLKKL